MRVTCNFCLVTTTIDIVDMTESQKWRHELILIACSWNLNQISNIIRVACTFCCTIYIFTIDIDNLFTSKISCTRFIIDVCMCTIVILFFPLHKNIALLHINIDVRIAHDLGFHSSQHLAGQFRAMFGRSMRSYRE